MASAMARISGSKVVTSNSTMAFAVCCIWSIESSIAVIRLLMSARSNGVMKVVRSSDQHLARDAVGLVLERHHVLEAELELVVAGEHLTERARRAHHHGGVTLEQGEEVPLARHQAMKPLQHRAPPCGLPTASKHLE